MPVSADGKLTAVELDPDFHLFRRLKPEEIDAHLELDPALRAACSSWCPRAELAEGYQIVVDSATQRAVLGEEGRSRKKGHEVVVRTAQTRSNADGIFGYGSVLIVGEAVKSFGVESSSWSVR